MLAYSFCDTDILMNDGAQLSLFDLGPAMMTPAQIRADHAAALADKIDHDFDMGLLPCDDADDA